jgi:hypothetical protein
MAVQIRLRPSFGDFLANVTSFDDIETKMRLPGIEPGPAGWKPAILTTRPQTLVDVSEPQGHVRRVMCDFFTGMSQNPSLPTGIEPVTFRLTAERSNH